MGWFSSSTTDSAPAPTGAPDRSARAQCWTGRDAYFACLDKNGVQVPGQEDGKCAQEDTEYRKVCAGSWVRPRSLVRTRMAAERLYTQPNGLRTRR